MKMTSFTNLNQIFRRSSRYDIRGYFQNGRFLRFSWLLLGATVLTLLITPATLAQGDDAYRQVFERGSAAGVDPDRLETVISRAQSRQLDPEDLADILTPAMTLAENDLPYNSALQKAMEGMAKRVPPAQVRLVLDNMANGLTRAAGIVDPWMNRQEVQAMVEAGRGPQDADAGAVRNQFRHQVLENASYALQQNMNEDHVRGFLDMMVTEQVTERGGMSSVASAIRALPDLPTTQDNPGMSNRILIRALNAGFSPGEIQQLPDAFRSAQFHSQMPAEHIARGMDRQMGDGIPAEHILQNLFQGDIGGGPPGFTPPGQGGQGDDQDRGRRGPPDNVPPGNN